MGTRNNEEQTRDKVSKQKKDTVIVLPECKDIYNTYLKVSRMMQNQPFRYRKNFQDQELINLLKRLKAFFEKYDHICIESFFEAPYFVYNDKFFPIEFYNTHKAVKAYSMYNDEYMCNNIDCIQHQKILKKSIEFVYNFCKQNNINVNEYVNYKKDSNYNVFLKHIRERRISIFIMFAFDNFEEILNRHDKEVKNMYNKNLLRVDYLRQKYYNSNIARAIIKKFKTFITKTTKKL